MFSVLSDFLFFKSFIHSLQNREDTKKLMKRYVDSSKSKKTSKSTKASNSMKPQTATNGLKRPLPSTAAVEDAKRMNIDTTAINIKKETEVKSEPKSDTSDNNLVGAGQPNSANHLPNLPPMSSVANPMPPLSSTEVKQEIQNSSDMNNANHSNNDVSLNDFELDLENTDFQVCKIRNTRKSKIDQTNYYFSPFLTHVFLLLFSIGSHPGHHRSQSRHVGFRVQ